MQTVWPQEMDSIFGDTYNGVPNPLVPHVHPYPTRYHGPIFTVPGSAHTTYRERPYAKQPYLGLGAAPLFEHVTGSGLFDALLGVAVGYVGAPHSRDRAVWMIGGGLAAYAAGLAGLVGTGAAALYLRSRR